MKAPIYIFICLASCLLIPLMTFQAFAQQPLKVTSADQTPQPMVIKANSLVVDDTNKIVTFSGQVNAQRQDFTIDCDKMIVHYQGSDAKTSGTSPGFKVVKIIAEGNVRITRKAGGEALAKHAEYYEGDDKVVLTGQPMVKQGQDFVQGDRITIFLKENRSVVEGSPQKKVKAVIYPKKKPK